MDTNPNGTTTTKVEEQARRQRRAALKELNLNQAGKGVFCPSLNRAGCADNAFEPYRIDQGSGVVPEAPYRPNQTDPPVVGRGEPRPNYQGYRDIVFGEVRGRSSWRHIGRDCALQDREGCLECCGGSSALTIECDVPIDGDIMRIYATLRSFLSCIVGSRSRIRQVLCPLCLRR